MTIERIVLAVAGTFILLSLALSQLHSPNWLWFTAFVGANLTQSAFTGFCPLALILKRLGKLKSTEFSLNPAGNEHIEVAHPPSLNAAHGADPAEARCVRGR